MRRSPGARPPLAALTCEGPAVERGVIHAAEWVGPHHDMKLGLHKAARHYPRWHEPGTVEEFGFLRGPIPPLPPG
jgi:TRAP-type mannitol/chloroaromatic compound transport system substrate-binding protein